MSTAIAMRKITISLPGELVAFADQRAEATNASRSQIISWVLAEAKARAEAALAAEGYQFYGQEATAFANSSERAVAEIWPVEAWDEEPSPSVAA